MRFKKATFPLVGLENSRQLTSSKGGTPNPDRLHQTPPPAAPGHHCLLITLGPLHPSLGPSHTLSSQPCPHLPAPKDRGFCAIYPIEPVTQCWKCFSPCPLPFTLNAGEPEAQRSQATLPDTTAKGVGHSRLHRWVNGRAKHGPRTQCNVTQLRKGRKFCHTLERG